MLKTPTHYASNDEEANAFLALGIHQSVLHLLFYVYSQITLFLLNAAHESEH